MKAWRKLHSSILESERFMDVSLEAKVLFFLLVVAQDDTGYYPWERMKVRRLVAACGWTESQAKNHAQSLVDGGMASWAFGGILLRNGAELNGTSRGDRKPFLYQRNPNDSPSTVSDIPLAVSDIPLVSLEIDKKEIRNRNREKSAKPTNWLPPDWFVPLIKLSGYKDLDHSRAAKAIEAACVEMGADVAKVVAEFAEHWPTLKVKYRQWHDPVATLKGKPLEIAINQSRNGVKPGDTSAASPKSWADIVRQPGYVYNSRTASEEEQHEVFKRDAEILRSRPAPTRLFELSKVRVDAPKSP